MKYDVENIEEYLEVLPVERKILIKKLISLVHEYFPGLEGNLQYGMPTFEPVCAMASQKNYISVYIHHTELVEKYKNDLNNLKVGKSCIRFKKKEELPEKTIRKIFSELQNKDFKNTGKTC